jgi:hypothetical protein
VKHRPADGKYIVQLVEHKYKAVDSIQPAPVAKLQLVVGQNEIRERPDN